MMLLKEHTEKNKSIEENWLLLSPVLSLISAGPKVLLSVPRWDYFRPWRIYNSPQLITAMENKYMFFPCLSLNSSNTSLLPIVCVIATRPKPIRSAVDLDF